MASSDIFKFNYNPIQKVGFMLKPHKRVDIWGRATGKSSAIAETIKDVKDLMPRVTGAIAGATYQQILTRTLPSTIESLERLGIFKGTHYFIGKRPDEKLRFREPFQPPLDYERFWIWNNGTGFHLTSQDREGKSRGMNVGYVLADEVLTMDKKKLEDEVFASNRGGIQQFGHVHMHHGFHLCSSMPTGPKSSWILDYGNYYQEDGNPIWPVWNKICQLQLKYIDSKDPHQRSYLADEIIKLRKTMRFYTNKDGLLFTVGNAFDNLANIGLQYIRDMRRQMSTLSFRIEILNEYIQAVEQNFYKLNEEKHFYNHFDYSFIDTFADKSNFDPKTLRGIDSRQDADVDPNRPLDMAVDFGAEINAMRIGQEHHSDFKGQSVWNYRYVKSFYVKHPEGLKDLVNKFASYYQYHRCKEIDLPYDHTAVGRDPVRDKFIDELIKELTAKGWKVRSHYIGQTAGHHNRYLLWEILLRGDDKRFPKVLFNRTNDWDGILSMLLAGTRTGKNGFEKDKRTEQSSAIPREQATDLSDAADTLVVWRYLSRMESSSSDSFQVIM
jgi:hypothetical protein